MDTRNSSQEIELRRRQNTLIIVGTGSIIFGGWAIIKTVGFFLVGGLEEIPQLRNLMTVLGQETDVDYYTLMVTAALIILAADLLIRIGTGWAALSVSRGGRVRTVYIILASLLILDSLLTLAGMAINNVEIIETVINNASDTTAGTVPDSDSFSIGAVIIELTAMIMMAEMLVSMIRIRAIAKQSHS